MLEQIEFIGDDSGQSFIEYVVLVSLVLFAATATYALFQTIRGRFEAANARLESLPYE